MTNNLFLRYRILVDKKYTTGLTPVETQELKELGPQVDKVLDAKGFNVIRTWSNWDSIREEIVSPEPFATRDAALEDAIRRRREHEKQYRLCTSAFIVRAVSEGVREYYEFPKGER